MCSNLCELLSSVKQSYISLKYLSMFLIHCYLFVQRTKRVESIVLWESPTGLERKEGEYMTEFLFLGELSL